MKKRNIVKAMCLTLSIMFVFMSSGLSAYAASSSKNSVISTSECAELAEYWLDAYYDDNTIIDEIVPISNGTEICSYCVSFTTDGIPDGYIVVDSNRYAVDNVTEFCFSGKGIYDLLCENYGERVDVNSNEKTIYSTGLFDYAIAVNDEQTVFYNSTHELLDRSTLTSQCNMTTEIKSDLGISTATRGSSTFSLDDDKETYYNGFFTSGTITSTGTCTPKTITNAGSFTPSLMSEYRVENGYSGNCTPTAAANLLSYYMENRSFSNLGNSRQDIYDRIVSGSGWNQFGNSGMSLSDAKKGMKSVVTAADYSFSSTDYWFDPWSSWKRDLGNNYPVLTAVYGYRQDDSGNWIEVGHSIVAIGYREYTSGANYLQVYDGWNQTSDKYIYFNANYFTSIEGMCIKVTN